MPSAKSVAGVVDDVVGAEGPDQVELAGAGHAGDLGSEGLGQLHGIAPDATGGADDQHALAGLEVADVGEGLQGGGRRDRDHRGLLEGEVGRFDGQLVLVGDGVLGERASPEAEDLVALGEHGHRRPDGHDDPGDIEPGHRLPGSAKPEREPAGIRQSCHDVPGRAGHAGGVDVQQHLVGGDARTRELCQAQHIGRPVPVLDDGAHRAGGTGRSHPVGVRGEWVRGSGHGMPV